MDAHIKLPSTLRSSLVERFLKESGVTSGNEVNEVVLDFDNVSFADPSGMVMLLEILRYLSSEGVTPKIRCSEEKDVYSYMERMGFWAKAEDLKLYSGPTSRHNERGHTDVLLEITEIRERKDVHRVLKRVRRAAEEILLRHLHYDRDEVSRFMTSISEVCQNILEHSGDWGYVAIQKYRYERTLGKNVVKMVVSDLGKGIKSTLGQEVREKIDAEWTDRVAIEEALYNSRSRFDDPGRGHGLTSVRTSADRWNGLLSIRSGTARVSMVPDWMNAPDVVESLPFFPGTQVVLMLPEKERYDQKSLF